MATQTDALRDELAAAGAPIDLTDSNDSADEDASAVALVGGAHDQIGPGPGLALVMFLLLPFVASLQFGLAFSAVGFSALGYGLYQAWTRTDGQGMRLELSGPFRVGQVLIQAR